MVVSYLGGQKLQNKIRVYMQNIFNNFRESNLVNNAFKKKI